LASRLTAGWRAKFSQSLLFNPTDPRSARYSLLLEARMGPDEVRDVPNIADVLVGPKARWGALERRLHREKTSHALLVGAILHVLYAKEEKTPWSDSYMLESFPRATMFCQTRMRRHQSVPP
jgi:type IV secretion system protein VirD4